MKQIAPRLTCAYVCVCVCVFVCVCVYARYIYNVCVDAHLRPVLLKTCRLYLLWNLRQKLLKEKSKTK